MYRFASSRSKVNTHDSPLVAFPPFTTVPFSMLMSAAEPDFVAFPLVPMIFCPGRASSETPI